MTMTKPDPLIPSLPGAQDIEAMTNRVKYLEQLFFKDGRDKTDHPMKGIYTGLIATYENIPEPLAPCDDPLQ